MKTADIKNNGYFDLVTAFVQVYGEKILFPWMTFFPTQKDYHFYFPSSHYFPDKHKQKKTFTISF